jgi:DNA polymerase-4
VGRSADLPRRSGEIDGDDTGCHILHVDMDAFFASVEVRRRPELRGRPVIVGGGVRGVVSAASYEARKFGVRSAMPMTRALRLCPGAEVVRPDHAAYRDVSAQVMGILAEVTELVEPLSLDEAFLDVSAATRRLGRPADIARWIRGRVVSDLGLTCSVGVASIKFVAKLASSLCKPDGLLVVPAGQTLDFLHPLPVTALWGVGPTTAAALRRRGVTTVADLAATPPDVLRRVVGASVADHLAALARGYDPRQVEPDRVEKSISSDRTFEVDLTNTTDIQRELLRLSDDVGVRLRAREMVARTVGIKVRFADFRTVTRAHTFADWTDHTPDIHAGVRALYAALHLDRPRIRLLGVKVENLGAAAGVAYQDTLDFGGAGDAAPGSAAPGLASARAAAAQRAADAATRRFGSETVRPASLLGTGPPSPVSAPDAGA